MRPLVICCSIASWLCFGIQFGSSVLANDAANCQIVATQAGQLFANGSPTNRLESFSSDSYIRMECTGNITGKLRLSLKSSKPYNGVVRFRVISTSGVFTPMTSDYADSPVQMAYTNATGRAAGEVRYQVQVVAPSGYLLPSAPDYAVELQAELVP